MESGGEGMLADLVDDLFSIQQIISQIYVFFMEDFDSLNLVPTFDERLWASTIR